MRDAAGTLLVEAAAGWDLGPGHPLRALRLELTRLLAGQLGLPGRPGVRALTAEPAGEELLLVAHDPGYLDLVRRAGRAGPAELLAAGLGTADTPVVPDLHHRAAAVVGAAAAAAAALADGAAGHAVALDGGLHHAMRSRAAGFCVYNDVVVAIRLLLDRGIHPVGYVDLDAHHGDGVEEAFADDPRVLTISVHQDGRTLFPGTGAATDTGRGAGEGSAANVALPAGTGDAGWLRAVQAVVPVLLRAAAPRAIVLQAGCDGHRADLLTDLRLSAQGLLAGAGLVHRLAHELCAGRLLVLGGGGYSAADAVPRTWTQLTAELTGGLLPWDTPLPEPWREQAARLAGLPPGQVPRRLGDADADLAGDRWDAGEGNPDDPVDRAIAATRRAVLPLWGLDPLVDR